MHAGVGTVVAILLNLILPSDAEVLTIGDPKMIDDSLEEIEEAPGKRDEDAMYKKDDDEVVEGGHEAEFAA